MQPTFSAYRCVLLGLSLSALDDDSRPSILLAYQASTDSLRVVVSEKDLSLLPRGAKDYVDACVSDWRETAPGDIPCLLASLSELSTGLLRTLDVTEKSEHELELLIDALSS